MRKIGIGFIGSGFAAELHTQALKRVPGFDLQFVGITSATFANAQAFAKRYSFDQAYETVDELLNDERIEVVHIITPPKSHLALIKQVMEKGKHVICEKPLIGAFGSGSDDKEAMYQQVKKELADLDEFLKGRKEQLFYAENYVYAPAVQKIRQVIEVTGEKFLVLRGDESHSGSHAAHAAHWSESGGGSLIRQGCHPLSALLYLKAIEAKRRGESIEVVSVLCDSAQIGSILKEEERGSILSRPVDVEDWAEMIITFSDGTRAIVESADMIVGGVRNSVEAYTANACYVANIAPNNAMMCYHGDDSNLGDVYITEKVETKMGWQHIFLAEEEMRGYVGEFEDFFQCLAEGKEAQSGFALARQTIEVLYAAYASVAMGKRFFME